MLPAAALGGHAVMAPGPDLAGWLACCQAADRDDAALVNSITAWRKVTSWAQAQELAAVAELARRRGVPGARDASGEDCDRAADAWDRGPVADASQALRAGADAFTARRSRVRPGSCTHEEASPGYRVPDPIRALVEARDRTCRFPTCDQPAWRCEQDHTIAYRLGGLAACLGLVEQQGGQARGYR